MKIKKVFLIVVAFFIINLSYIVINVNAFTYGNIEEKIYCNTTLDEKFNDQSIIITLSNAESLLFRDYGISDFADINCIEVLYLL